MTNVNNSIPVVRSIAVYRFCQALERNAIHVPSNDVKLEMILAKPRKGKQTAPAPFVYSVILLKMGEVLDLKVELLSEYKDLPLL
ncbi:hypothetical protein TNIN_146451 [Trichonephila inaurata madagascariensis]|uniref:Uncharacterized protein n=1 Tax=Trichonephila inaurata madagascariensis TaxID=2747483 RepID=A0A8X6WM07_9ARAC|nr:hypothetical protein TNIN_146451 [Trichonephila inaurata madagascariensis]